MDPLTRWSSWTALLFNLIFGPVGLLLNGVLLFCVVKHTPVPLVSYSTLIRFRTIVDLVSSFTAIMVSNRLFPSLHEVLIISRGPCTIFFSGEHRAHFCFYWYSMQSHSLVLSHLILLLSFCYRIRVVYLCFDSFDQKVILVFCIVFGVTFLCFSNWVYYMSLEPMELVNRHVQEISPALVNSTVVYYGVVSLQNPSVRVMHILSIGVMWVVIAASCISWYLLVDVMSKFRSSRQLTESHFSLMKVLMAETLVPLFSVLSFALYVSIGFIDKKMSPLPENLLGIPVVLQSLVSPIFTFLYIKPYLKALRRIVLVKTTVTMVPAIRINFPST